MDNESSWFARDSLRLEDEAGSVQAVYRFRYIALQFDYLERVADKDISWFGEDKSEKEYIAQEEELNQIFHKILENKSSFVSHEVSHHNLLKESTFWIYINLCETWRRMICISCALKKSVSEKSRAALIRVSRDKMLVKKCIIPLEEHRQALVDRKRVREESAYRNIQDSATIERFYSSIDALRSVFSIKGFFFEESDVQNSVSNDSYAKIIWLFLRRQVFRNWIHIMPFAFRMLRPDVFLNFTCTLISNLSRFREISDHPGFRTFNRDGVQVAFDPGSQFAGRKVRCDPLELRVARKEFGEFNETIKWVNYLAEKKAWRDVLNRAYFKDQRDYIFLSKWLYSNSDYAEDLRYFERTIDDVLKIFDNSKLHPINWMKQCRELIDEKRRKRYPELNEVLVYRLIDSYYVHGV